MSRMLIWIPAPVHEVRPALHRSGVGSGILVPVESGTVIVPRDRMGPSVAAQWVYGFVRQTKKAAVVIAWDHAATMILPISGPVALGWDWGGDKAVRDLFADLSGNGPLKKAGLAIAAALSTSKRGKDKQARAVKRITEALGADEATVLKHVQRYEQRLPPEVLLDEIGKPDVAAVVRAIDEGRFNAWRTGRSMMAEWHRASGAIVLVGFLLAIIVTVVVTLTLPFVSSLTVVLIPLLIALVMMLVWRRIRYRTRRMPIDEVLPVHPMPDASDNQSAR